jgi:hypothetical protein
MLSHNGVSARPSLTSNRGSYDSLTRLGRGEKRGVDGEGGASSTRWRLLAGHGGSANPSYDLTASILRTVGDEMDRGGAFPVQTPLCARGAEVDVVCSGGGMRGYYVTGAYCVLRRLQARGDLVVRRFAGASAGAWCAIFMCCDMDPMDWVETYWLTKRAGPRVKLLDAYLDIIPRMILRTLPEDAHLRCSGRVFISITVWRDCALHNEVVSEFRSKEDLVAAAVASSNIPRVSVDGWGKTFRGERVFDGGFTNNLPHFRDGLRPQLSFNLALVSYPFQATLAPTDPCIEALIFRGALEMHRFAADPEGGRGAGGAGGAAALLPVSLLSVADEPPPTAGLLVWGWRTLAALQLAGVACVLGLGRWVGQLLAWLAHLAGAPGSAAALPQVVPLVLLLALGVLALVRRRGRRRAAREPPPPPQPQRQAQAVPQQRSALECGGAKGACDGAN